MNRGHARRGDYIDTSEAARRTSDGLLDTRCYILLPQLAQYVVPSGAAVPGTCTAALSEQLHVMQSLLTQDADS